MLLRTVVMVHIAIGIFVVGVATFHVVIVVNFAIVEVAKLQISILNGLFVFRLRVVAVYRLTEASAGSLASL